MDTKKGTLFIVSTPIGNLKDISFRAIETLKKVDLIYSEDTRETSKILKYYEIDKPQKIYTDQRHLSVFNDIKQALDNGLNIALVSDSGTPLISDPGYKLISQLRELGCVIKSVPGASAVISALSVSGLPTDNFVFLGFLPKKSGGRNAILEEYGKLPATLTIYESPYRLERLIKEALNILGNRKACVVKDITKLYEQVMTSTLEELSQTEFKQKGEYILLIAKKGI